MKKTAKQMFKELGLKDITKKEHDSYVVKAYCMKMVKGESVLKIKDWKYFLYFFKSKVEILIGTDKYCRKGVCVASEYIEDIKKLKKIILNKQLLQAINKQVEELRWGGKENV